MSNVKWGSGFSGTYGSSSYVLDITASSGSTQMYLFLGWPDSGNDALTQANADDTAATLQSTVDGLSDVVSSVLTPSSIQGPLGTVSTNFNAFLVFDVADYAQFAFSLTLPSLLGNSNSASLITASPADGKLSATDLATVTSALVTFIETLSTVTACTVEQQIVVPSTL